MLQWTETVWWFQTDPVQDSRLVSSLFVLPAAVGTDLHQYNYPLQLQLCAKKDQLKGTVQTSK